MSDTDMSDDEDYDEKHDDDDHDGPQHVEGEKDSAATSNVAGAVAAGAATAAAGVAVAAMAAPPQQPAQTARQLPGGQPNGADSQANGKAPNGKEAYKVTVKDLKDIDERAEKKQEAQTTLERRWAAFSFYFLASLSIILPVVFLVLACFIMAMNGKSVDSNWGKIIDPIKIAITVWPIVFAAVTAQGFKTWAAYKVERGVKLMELEQLVGSSSFAAVMKQPFFLRRLDLLTIGIFIIWALSPIGSQALIRSYSLDRASVTDRVEVLYVPLLGNNTLLSPGAEQNISGGLALGELWQVVASYYMATFIPRGIKSEGDSKSYGQDSFNHPLPAVSQFGGHNYWVSSYGIPLAMPQSALMIEKLAIEEPMYNEGKSPEEVEKERKEKALKAGRGAVDPFEKVMFPITSSYFAFDCGNWTLATFDDLTKSETMTFSLSETLGLEFLSPPDTKAINRIRYATLQKGTELLKGQDWDELPVAQSEWTYAVVSCGMKQVFYNASVLCSINTKTDNYAFDCEITETKILPDDQVRREWETPIEDFSDAFVRSGNPYPVLSPYTPTERYAYTATLVGQDSGDIDPIGLDSDGFERNFGLLFNTWVTISHCTECANVYNHQEVNDTTTTSIRKEHQALYKTVETPDGKAERIHSPASLAFKLDWRWVAVFLTSVIILLLVGIASVVLEGMLIAPDVLGYASTLARNSRYLHLPKTAAKPMSGPERARAIGGVKVMIQDVKPDKDVGKIALGLKHDRAEPLKPGRLYR
ncbi:hypothetical protein B0T16DRAFT_420578 [Cercophora newfieldiana]|uniref:Uncharacterized protein n=1 Tax=Cercophora newfieldiana TaxID=92897 RepID=A0AA40CLX4_9PEZI|nr:hypothetical protein B0T16DRAFT_420578 [Cercophora newfieldiana]